MSPLWYIFIWHINAIICLSSVINNSTEPKKVHRFHIHVRCPLLWLQSYFPTSKHCKTTATLACSAVALGNSVSILNSTLNFMTKWPLNIPQTGGLFNHQLAQSIPPKPYFVGRLIDCPRRCQHQHMLSLYSELVWASSHCPSVTPLLHWYFSPVHYFWFCHWIGSDDCGNGLTGETQSSSIFNCVDKNTTEVKQRCNSQCIFPLW